LLEERLNIVRKKFVIGLFLILIVGLLPVRGRSKLEESVDIPKLTVPPKIDGILDNPLWENQALKIDDFLQFAPKEKGIPTQKTVVYIGYDHKNLYVAFQCYDSEPEKIRASITNRDSIIDDDWVAVFIDTFNEKRRAFTFIINPLGVQLDCIRMEEGGNETMDESWDTVFDSDGDIDGKGYTVEMAIPFKSIRFPDEEVKVWNLFLGRSIARNGEIITWPGLSREIPGLISQGQIVVIRDDVEKGKNFELMPIFTSLKTKDAAIDPQPGLNFKWGMSSDLTMDLTLNPDFSHIEADAPQIDVNQRFALYYNEKRPFFLEGMEIFQFPDDGLDIVYTRRIVDPAGGAKLSGKIGRFTYGLLSAYDVNPTENLWEVSGSGEHRQDKALFNIFRMKTDVFNQSYIGLCLTDKEIDGSFNRVVAVDGQLRFNDKYFITFQASGSKTKFSDKETNVVPALYSQFMYLSKYAGGGVWWKSIHPDFEASSGFVNRVDYKSYGVFSFLNAYPQKQYLNQLRLSLSAGIRDSYFEDIVQNKWIRTNLQFRFTEFNQLYITYMNEMERYEGIDFYKNWVRIEGENNLISWMPFGLYFQTGNSIFYDPDDPFMGWSNTYGVYVQFKPNKRLRVGMEFNKQTFWKKWGGELMFDFNVVRQRITYQISKALSLRAIMDYNHFDKEIYGSFLVSYILKPGTVFFLGIDNDFLQRESGGYAQNAYSVFLKFSYWWRI
jgi:hypothetical protein